jgi:23S rRNA (adenine2503-C2)-methyltransferase
VNGSVDSLSEYGLDDFPRQLAAWGFKPSHASRLLRAYYAGNGEIDGSRTILPQPLIERLQASGFGPRATLLERQVAADGTTKLLLRLGDGRAVEAVLMPDFHPDRAAGCISSQVGCAMGCDFCATTKTGFERNLTAGEMVEQFLALRREAAAVGRRLRTVVFMGMGEPMLNLENVIAAVKRMADNKLGALGWRQITVSTVGVVAGIDALAEANLNVHLAVSLHAPDDETRALLLPSGRRFRVGDILAAADRYQARTGRPVVIQYCLLRGINDSPAQAQQLAELLGARRMHVNLLHYNPTGISLRGATYEAAPLAVAERFIAELRARGVVAHFRRSRGQGIDAACGQLRERARPITASASGR